MSKHRENLPTRLGRPTVEPRPRGAHVDHDKRPDGPAARRIQRFSLPAAEYEEREALGEE